MNLAHTPDFALMMRLDGFSVMDGQAVRNLAGDELPGIGARHVRWVCTSARPHSWQARGMTSWARVARQVRPVEGRFGNGAASGLILAIAADSGAGSESRDCGVAAIARIGPA